MGLQDILGSALGGGSLGKIATQLGADEATAGSAVVMALPELLGRMANNTETDEGANALATAVNKDHDGGLLDMLDGFLGGGHASG